MIMKIYSVYDSKTEVYSHPMFMKTKGEALRSWSVAVNDQQSAYFKHPEDYTLFEIGEYSDEDAKLIAHSTPLSCGVAIEFKQTDI